MCYYLINLRHIFQDNKSNKIITHNLKIKFFFYIRKFKMYFYGITFIKLILIFKPKLRGKLKRRANFGGIHLSINLFYLWSLNDLSLMGLRPLYFIDWREMNTTMTAQPPKQRLSMLKTDPPASMNFIWRNAFHYWWSHHFFVNPRPRLQKLKFGKEKKILISNFCFIM